MITYWTFTGKYPIAVWFPGLPLVGFVGAALVPALLGESGMNFWVTAAIIGGDILLGAVWLWARSAKASAITTSLLTAVVLIAAVFVASAPILERKVDVGLRTAFLAVFGSAPRVDDFRFNRIKGDITITSADIGPSYIIPDRSDFLENALGIDFGPLGGGTPVAEILDPYFEKADGLRADIVENKIRISGIQEGYESVYITVFARIKTDPEKISLSQDKYKVAEWRALPGKLFNITSSDLERGYVALPLVGDNLTLANHGFYDKNGPDSYIYHIVRDVLDKI